MMPFILKKKESFMFADSFLFIIENRMKCVVFRIDGASC